jgi:hypothetical protein
LHICADGEPERRLRQLVAGDLSGWRPSSAKTPNVRALVHQSS